MRDRLPAWAQASWDFVDEVLRRGAENDLALFAPAMAYSLVLSLAPLAIALNSVGSRVLTAGMALPGESPAAGVQTSIAEFASGTYGWAGPAAGLIAALLVLWGAAGLFRQLTGAVARIWKAPGRQQSWVTALRRHLFAFLLLLVAGIALFLSAALGNALAAVTRYLADLGAELGISFEWVDALMRSRLLFDFAFSVLLLGTVFVTVPLVRPRFRDILPGTILTGGAYALGQWVLGAYLSSSARFDALGTFGVFLGFLVWAYYTALIILWGAQITYVLAARRACRRGGGDEGPYTCGDPTAADAAA